MKSEYFELYENYFKDANEFLNSVETKNNLINYSYTDNSAVDFDKESINSSENKIYSNFYLYNETNKNEYFNHKEKKHTHILKNDKINARIFFRYGKLYNMCFDYIPYDENINYNEKNNFNNSIIIFKSKYSSNIKRKVSYSYKKEKLFNFLKKIFCFNEDKNIKENKKNKCYNITNGQKKRKRKDIDVKYQIEINFTYSSNDLNRNNIKYKIYDSNQIENLKKIKSNRKNDKYDKLNKSDKDIKKIRDQKKGISYAHLLKKGKNYYNYFYLYNPRFKQGKHHTVMHLQSYNVSIIPFVKPKKLKEEVNNLFSEINPWIHKSLTLSKLRNLKIDLFNLINDIPELDISTVSCAWVFFERLICKGYVHKYNRKLYAATCLILSLKFYQHDDIHILIPLLTHIRKMDKKENLTSSLIFAVEFKVYCLLDFSLQHTYEHIRPHIQHYLESKELKFEDIYGKPENIYLCQNDSNEFQ